MNKNQSAFRMGREKKPGRNLNPWSIAITSQKAILGLVETVAERVIIWLSCVKG
jgi:hypothetical protein